MIYLLLCIISNAGIFVVFKIAGNLKLDTFRIIIINYIAAAILGFSIGNLPEKTDLNAGWIPMAITIGILFIVVFFVIALSTQKAGIAVTSVASKMSVVIPIIFSLFYFNEPISVLKVTGIILALASVFMTTYNRDKSKKRGVLAVLLPIILFFSAGIIDSLIKYTQEVHIADQGALMFSSILFSISAITGLIFSIFKKGVLKPEKLIQTILAGIILGIVNFFSLYGIIMALESYIFESSIVFGINNMGIVVLSVIIALIFFNEKLSNLNKAGIVLSILTIIFLSYL
ncbi:MAG: EamA family transporter [Bacteroidota bacterium]|nr:EamA family transporter [Bacteroidota bacterium]